MQTLLRLASSRKAMVTILCVVGAFVSLHFGKATWEQVDELLKWVLGSWLLAQGAEDAAKHIAQPRVDAVVKAVQDSLHPPPPARKETLTFTRDIEPQSTDLLDLRNRTDE